MKTLILLAALSAEIDVIHDAAPNNTVIVDSCQMLLDMNYRPSVIIGNLENMKAMFTKSDNGLWVGHITTAGTYHTTMMLPDYMSVKHYYCALIRDHQRRGE